LLKVNGRTARNQRLLHPVIAIVAGSEQEASPDVGRELDHQTNLRRTTMMEYR